MVYEKLKKKKEFWEISGCPRTHRNPGGDCNQTPGNVMACVMCLCLVVSFVHLAIGLLALRLTTISFFIFFFLFFF